MQAKRIANGGTIGIFCPSHVADMERYDLQISSMIRYGFKVKLGDNFTKDTYGYAASSEERADDLNRLVSDEDVGIILFNGGESAVEVLPFIDYENIKKHPKIFSSYSDGTSILNAIYTKTGLTTYYGFAAGQFGDLRYYDYMQFCSHFVEGYASPTEFVKNSSWNTLNSGLCEGTLIGGYTALFALMLGNTYFRYNEEEKYLLFLEDHEMFSNVGAVVTYLTFIGQSQFMKNVTGLVFGHYSEEVPDILIKFLERFGKRYNIPVVYTDDFGHGVNHAIIPIGQKAKLNADSKELFFVE